MRTAQGGAAGKMTDRFYSWPPSPPCERRRIIPRKGVRLGRVSTDVAGEVRVVYFRCGST